MSITATVFMRYIPIAADVKCCVLYAHLIFLEQVSFYKCIMFYLYAPNAHPF